MMLKTGIGMVALAMMLDVTGVVAQTAAPAQRPAPTAPSTAEVPKAPVPGQILAQDANTVLAKDLIGQPVYAADKAKIGSISDLILSKNARAVEGFVIGVGGFLGLGEKTVALKMDRLQIQHNGDGSVQLMMDVKKEELANAPAFWSKREMEADRQAAERTRSQPAPTPRPTQKP